MNSLDKDGYTKAVLNKTLFFENATITAGTELLVKFVGTSFNRLHRREVNLYETPDGFIVSELNLK